MSQLLVMLLLMLLLLLLMLLLLLLHLVLLLLVWLLMLVLLLLPLVLLLWPLVPLVLLLLVSLSSQKCVCLLKNHEKNDFMEGGDGSSSCCHPLVLLATLPPLHLTP